MSMELKVTGYLIHKETCEEIETALGRVSNVLLSMHLQNDGWSLKSIGKEEMPDIIIHEIDGNSEEDLNDLENILQKFAPQVTVYVTYKKGDMETMRRLMKAGVRDAFPQPIQVQELVNDVTKVLSDKRARLSMAKDGKGKIVSFLPAKGGSGASTIAVNVAELLADSFEAKVLLIDLDVQLGDAALSLDLMPSNNVMEALLQPGRVDPVFIKALITKHESGLDVMASPADISLMGGITPEGVTHLIDAAAESYDFVILDVPLVFTSWTMAALRYSDPIMLVLQNNLVTIRDAKMILDKMKHEGIPSDNIEVINNRAMAKDASIPIDKVKDTLGIERIHKVCNDYKTVVHSRDQGRPADDVSESSSFTKNIHSLAKYIYGLQKGEPKKKGGIFSNLFSK